MSRLQARTTFPDVYPGLRRMAARWLEQEPPGHTLQPTALVHEAYLRLVGSDAHTGVDQEHLHARAATAMRRVLVDHARRKRARKRELPSPMDGEGETAVGTLDGLAGILDLEQGLGRLALHLPRACQVVELRFYGGLTVDETASVLGVSPRTVDLDWRFARAWLLRSLGPEALS